MYIYVYIYVNVTQIKKNPKIFNFTKIYGVGLTII